MLLDYDLVDPCNCRTKLLYNGCGLAEPDPGSGNYRIRELQDLDHAYRICIIMYMHMYICTYVALARAIALTSHENS